MQYTDRTRAAAEQYRQARATWFKVIADKRPIEEIDAARHAFDKAAHGVAFEACRDLGLDFDGGQ